MAKTAEIEMTVKVFYKEDGINVIDIIKDSLIVRIEKEVIEICSKISWLSSWIGLIIIM